MQKEENGEKTDILKLFIVLMTLAAVGFGVGAAYLYHSKSKYAETYEKEKKALEYIIKVAKSPENKGYWGFQPKGSGATTGAELPTYLINKAKMHGIPFKDYRTDTDPHPSKGYSETKVNVKLTEVTVEQVVRYLYNVKQGKKDIALSTLRLSNFDYEQPVPTCNATLDAIVYEDLKSAKKR